MVIFMIFTLNLHAFMLSHPSTQKGGASIKAELKYKAICMIPHTQDIRERANPRSIAFP